MLRLLFAAGLIHKSQMSKSHVEEPEEVVAIGDNVYVKVISIDVSQSRNLHCIFDCGWQFS